MDTDFIYTFEASFFGSTRTINEKKHFTIQDFKNLGVSLGKALYRTISKDFNQKDSPKRPSKLKQSHSTHENQ